MGSKSPFYHFVKKLLSSTAKTIASLVKLLFKTHLRVKSRTESQLLLTFPILLAVAFEDRRVGTFTELLQLDVSVQFSERGVALSKK